MDTKSFGSWKSPISGKSLVQSSIRLGQIHIDGDSIFWTEGRPTEKGRTALMHWSAADSEELTSVDTDVRTRAHEYGGGAFLCARSRCFYVDNSDQQIYEIIDQAESRQLTNHPNYRYADFVLDEHRNLLYAVGENHEDKDNVENCLIAIGLGNGDLEVIAEGHDFYSNPQLSPDKSQLLFLVWDHPNMPWDATRLMLADLDTHGHIETVRQIAGGADESIFQPIWDPDGSFYFVSDRNNWWNIYRYSSAGVDCVLQMEAEFGSPQWIFGMSKYAVLNTGDLVATYNDQSGCHLVRIDVKQNETTEIKTRFTHIEQLRGFQNKISFVGYQETAPSEIVAYNFTTDTFRTLQKASEIDLDGAYISKAQSIQFETAPDELSYAWFYAPKNPLYKAPEEELPPLIVLSHGGPTAHSFNDFNLTIQYWTSRGFAIVDVNYSGSTGFGRKYRERLKGNWGIRDVQDCAAAATYLADVGKVDREKLIIKGGSAGGYTTLMALTFLDVFKAGASYYGVGDLTMLAEDTHKFESRYLDTMIGPYPEKKQIYRERSPLNYASQLNCPVIFFQGLDDPVVPPSQAEGMVSELKRNGIPVAYLAFEGESHGFRKSSTIIKAIESEYYFYTQIFGIQASEALEAIEIFNLN